MGYVSLTFENKKHLILIIRLLANMMRKERQPRQNDMTYYNHISIYCPPSMRHHRTALLFFYIFQLMSFHQSDFFQSARQMHKLRRREKHNYKVLGLTIYQPQLKLPLMTDFLQKLLTLPQILFEIYNTGMFLVSDQFVQSRQPPTPYR